MSDPVTSKIRRLSELPRDIAPPHDGWPSLEAKLRESAAPRPSDLEQHEATEPAGHRRPPMMRIAGFSAALAAVFAAVVIGISIDRWILSPSVRPAQHIVASGGNTVGAESGGVPVAYVTDPRYLHEREALLRSLNARLAHLPPASRQKVLTSLAAIHQSMQQIQQALGREPGNALLQELLIDSYQNEMQVLSTVQQAGDGGESGT